MVEIGSARLSSDVTRLNYGTSLAPYYKAQKSMSKRLPEAFLKSGEARAVVYELNPERRQTVHAHK